MSVERRETESDHQVANEAELVLSRSKEGTIAGPVTVSNGGGSAPGKKHNYPRTRRTSAQVAADNAAKRSRSASTRRNTKVAAKNDTPIKETEPAVLGQSLTKEQAEIMMPLVQAQLDQLESQHERLVILAGQLKSYLAVNE